MHTEGVLSRLRGLATRRTASSLADEVVSGMRDGLALQDDAGRLVEWNPAAATITGWSAADAAERLRDGLADGLVDLGGGRWVDVRHFPVERHGRTFLATLFSDARHQVALRDAYSRLNDLVTTDPLTGLPNRLLADDRLRLSLTLAQRDARAIAVLFVDLDRFKLINDTLGHLVGDDVLQQVAGRFREAIRESDTVARIGGDEFLVILHAIANPLDAEKVADSILQAMTRGFELAGHEVYVGASVGIAVYPEHGASAEDLVSHADLAMYRAKADGGNSYRLYAAVMSERSRERLLIAGELRRALDRRELVVHYQPQIDIDSGMAVGAEALVRWQHPHRGLLSPGMFLDVAEEDGAILEIDRWVLRTACRQLRRWDEDGHNLTMVAVNLSARTMQHGAVVDMVADELLAAMLSPARLEIEVSEHVVAGDDPNIDRTLAALKEIGVQLAIDDFGVGYSSLGHIKRFPVDAIKLDRSFVVDVTDKPGPADMAVLRAVVAMASELNLRCIAEGVETVAQRRMLKYLQCHLVQGFLYSEAVDPGELVACLRGPLIPIVALAGG